MPIRLLPDALVNRIRAGEVVERPAQIAKELIENALDAEARSVRVSLRDGGRALVAVEDDGTGMPSEDVALAVERHATSKLPDDDLGRIATLGFRGEALAAIGAVARLTVASRVRGGDCGWAIEVDNGAKGALRPCGHRCGTRVEARDLFAAHPARAAFLKAPRHEQALIRAAVEAHALARPDVAFILDADGRRLLTLPVADWEERVRAVAGAEFMANSVAVAAVTPELTLRGRVGLPTWTGHTATGQRVLVNGRPVRDRVIASALRAAFADVSGEKAPAAVLDLRVPGALLDVNVHPAKAEIRFADERAVHEAVRTAAAAALGARGPLAASGLSHAAAAAARPVAAATLADDPLARPLGRALGLALGTFVVAETSRGIVLVDMHAAHERVVHERLKRAALADGIAGRALPAPVAVRVGDEACALLAERADSLARLGLAVQAADGGTALVTAVPDPLYGADAGTLLREVAAALVEDPHADPLRDRLERLCALLACHAAIRAGDTLSLDEMNALLREIEATPNAAQCNHGRPTTVEMPRSQVESLFRRR